MLKSLSFTVSLNNVADRFKLNKSGTEKQIYKYMLVEGTTVESKQHMKEAIRVLESILEDVARMSEAILEI